MVTEQEDAPSRKKRILVVDDHEDNIEVLRARLEARGYEVEGATNGQAALDTVGHWCPDLILLDVMMPDMDGLEVVQRLKADKNLPFIPVIMQTALDSTERMVAGLEAGADDYVTKPINFAELEARVRSLLRIKKLQQELGDREKELSQMNDRLLHISMTDGLTGVDNRRALEQRLHEMFEHSLRLHEPISCVMSDIDHFKKVNDTHGHRAGDLVLTEVARVLARHGVAGRLGGDEFGVWVRGTEELGRAAALAMAEDVEAALPVELVTADPAVGLSTGVAVAHDGADVMDLIEAADRDLPRERRTTP